MVVLSITTVGLVSVVLGRITGLHAFCLLVILLALYSDDMHRVTEALRSLFALLRPTTSGDDAKQQPSK